MKPLLLIATLLIASFAMSQKGMGVVKGTVKDAGGEALPEATVSLMTTKDSSLTSFTVTSNTGFFEIRNIADGAYYLLVSYGGFETFKKPFLISTEKNTIEFGALQLEKAYKTLGEVIVTLSLIHI